MNEVTNIYNKLNNLKKEIVKQNEQDKEDISEKYEKIKKLNKKDMIVSNILEEKDIIPIKSIKELVKQMKQKNFMENLSKQYSTFKKAEHENCMKQEFLKELKKLNIMEKKEAMMRELVFKTNYDLRIDINKLKEIDFSRERNIFNKKTIKIRQMNINNIESFMKNMNKC